MTDDKPHQKMNERPKHVKPEHADQQALESKVNPETHSRERPAPGRRPLFRI